jgi:hypothetical protein
MRRCRTILTQVAAVVTGLSVVGLAHGEHARIRLDVVSPQEQATAYVDQSPPATGKNPRPVVHARVGEPIRVEYQLTNVYPNKTLTDAVVHFYVARVNSVGQKTLPDLSDQDAIVLESALDLDLRPGGHTGARSKFRINEPGVYLIRVETRQTQSDHEHFSAVDLVVDPKAP